MRMVSARTMRRVLNLWPPFLFTGIHVSHIGEDYRSARVELRMRPWNRNYVGTHFGGSLFAMTDPFWMLLVMHAIGEGYLVWDKTGRGWREGAALVRDPGARRIGRRGGHGAQATVRAPEAGVGIDSSRARRGPTIGAWGPRRPLDNDCSACS